MGNNYDIMLRNRHLQDINPMACGHEKCAPGHFYGPAQRTYWLLHYVEHGEGTLRTPRGKSFVAPGQIFVIRPGETTLYTASTSNPWQYIWVGFETSLPLAGVLGRDILTLPEAGPVFRTALGCENRANTELYLAGKIFELLSILPAPEKEGLGVSGYVERACNYINANYQKEIKICDLAKNLNIDRSYFSNLFHNATGLSPQQYLVRCRLKKAAGLMRRDGVPPGQAALMVGYPDAASFSRMFRRHYGVSPTQYAKGETNRPPAL